MYNAGRWVIANVSERSAASNVGVQEIKTDPLDFLKSEFCGRILPPPQKKK